MEITQSFSSTLKLDESSGNGMYSLSISLNFPAEYQVLSQIIEIRFLRAKAHIKSIAKVPLINFEDTDSDAIRVQKAQILEWDSERIQLDIYLGNAVNSSQFLGAISLLNNAPSPYREYNLLSTIGTNSFLISSNQSLYFRINDVGYGNLSSTLLEGGFIDKDWVSITAFGVASFYLEDKPQTIIIDQPLNINPLTLNLKGLTIVSGNQNNNDNINNDEEDDDMAAFVTKNSNYTIAVGERIKVIAGASPITITLPLNPIDGDMVEIISLNDITQPINIDTNGKKFYNILPSNLAYIKLTNSDRGGKLIYSDFNGWVIPPGYSSRFNWTTAGGNF
jgi:hypothetical protein